MLRAFRRPSGRAAPAVRAHLCLLLSGMAGLFYEILWTRVLCLSFGHTVYAATTVLAVFMGGLALGSRCLGPLADAVERPLRLYALLEIGTGLYCLAAPDLLSLVRRIYLASPVSLAGAGPGKLPIQFLLAAGILIVPTALMGGTLPAMARALVDSPASAGRRTGTIYGANTIGAAIGALAAGYWLLPSAGVGVTNAFGAGANIIAGLLALLPAAPAPNEPPPGRDGSREHWPPEASPLPGVLLLSFAVSGAVGLSLQVAWVRSLILVIGSSTYAFSAILVTVLAGIALGGFLFSRLRTARDGRFFAALQLGIAASGIVLIPTFERLPPLFLFLVRNLKWTFGAIIFLQFLIVFLVAIVPATLMGMTFPCLAGIAAGRRFDRLGADLGRIYAWNTVGAVAGTAAAGFLLIPALGTRNTIALACVLSAVAGTAVGWQAGTNRKTLALSLIGVLVVAAVLPAWDRNVMASGVFYRGLTASRIDELTTLRFGDMPYFREGVSSTVAVYRTRDGSLSLLVNGKVDASTGGDMDTQLGLANVPMLLHPRPRRIAVIGLGSGVTAGAAAIFPGAEQVDVVELEPSVAAAARFFAPVNFRVLENPRVRVIVDDARSYMEAPRARYDVIISEPSNPWMAGIGNLYTREFFAAVRERLSDDGLFCQWVQGYGLSLEDLKMVIRTFGDAFPDASLWAIAEDDFVLLGRGSRAAAARADAVAARTPGDPRLRGALRYLGDHPVDGVLAGFLLGAEELRAFAGAGPRNTDDLPLLEYRAPASLYRNVSYEANLRAVLDHKRSDFPSYLPGARPLTREDRMRRGRYLLGRDRPVEAEREFVKALGGEAGVGAAGGLGEGEATRIPAPAPILRDSFDGRARAIPIVPRLGGYRPGDGERNGLAVWRGNMGYFREIAGIRDGTGTSGSAGLVVRSVAGVVSSGYFSALAVKPGATYTVEFSVKSDLSDGGEAGAGWQEYDAPLASRDQLTLEATRDHLLFAKDAVRVRGPVPWQRRSFSFRTTERTRMIHLLFFREGRHDGNAAVFDDVAVREERSPGPPGAGAPGTGNPS